MVTKEGIENCIKNKIISNSRDCIEGVLETHKVLHPEEIEGKYGNPRRALMSTIETYLDFLYQDAQRVAAIDLSCLSPDKKE